MKTIGMQGFVAFVAGLLFALGLAVGGMTEPGNVIGFLDFAGEWKPALGFVMAGAVGVSAITWRIVRRREAPICAGDFNLPTRRDLDARLIGGAAIFGIGWGLGGYCPGPGLVSLATGAPSAFVFVASMIGGTWLASAWERSRQTAAAEPSKLA
ncbi:DUF6691 family protein [Vulgatibacter incomptus]|uniref:YeeE/YedE family protein n=1 Tax=Vulgatibacter incomptus TaxID=1391653 RepID=A0A0K1PG14_9BACT|nr:DUF6691 family protein [Vulgatibacter incomptus]AKU92447.1 hypothetical protein AKJ08_2834 [Vulgatibacter incomptus]